MAEIWTMGELLVEIMREKEGSQLYDIDTFRGPFPSGAPGIFISTVARLGHRAGIIGGVGKDDFGKAILDRLKKDGVDCQFVLESTSNSTGVAFVTYFEDGSRKFIFHMGNTPAVEPKAPETDALTGSKYFHIMGCSLTANKEFTIEIIKTMERMKQAGAKITFDPNIRLELIKNQSELQVINQILQETNIFMPGVEELLLITGETEIEAAVQKCFQNQELEILTLKKGSKGCTIYTRNERTEMGVYPVKTVDATGAGDSFDGAFICGLAEGKTVKEAAKMAAAAGALNAAAFGPMEGKISPENMKKIIAENEGK